jgi:hypothetical protein
VQADSGKTICSPRDATWDRIRVFNSSNLYPGVYHEWAATVEAPSIESERLHVAEKMFVVMNLISFSRALGTKGSLPGLPQTSDKA